MVRWGVGWLDMTRYLEQSGGGWQDSAAICRIGRRLAGYGVTWQQRVALSALIDSVLVGSSETSLGGVPREQKMLKGHLPRVIHHQVY